MFFSSVRIFLGVPVSFALFAYWAESSFKAISYNLFWKSVALTFFLAIGIICSSDRNRFFMDKLHKSYGDDDVVSVLPVKSYLQDCDNFNNLCKAYHTNLIILDAWPLGVNYMAPALNYKFKILSPRNERRTWDMQQEDTTIRQDFILLPQMPDSFGKTVHYGINIKSTYDPSAFLINTHGRKVFDILKDLDIKVVWH